ncbi:MAG: hypothetical protein GC171_12985 [Terrimonas sp.]|nr:hypothetical protein [Terrimonas sp.]
MSSFIHSLQSEFIKTKRSSSFWLSVIGALFIPVIFFLMYTFKADVFSKDMADMPWQKHFMRGWQSLSSFLLPMFAILTCSLVVQIEYKNNGWKQVFASPQPLGNIFFSKYLSIHGMIIFCIILFNVFMVICAVAVSLINSKYHFLHKPFNIVAIMKLSVKTYISILAIMAIQYWLSLRFKNFIAPIGIGLGLLITSLILLQWEHIDWVPYAYPILTFMKASPKNGQVLLPHELHSIIIFVVVTIAAFLDMKYRKERG